MDIHSLLELFSNKLHTMVVPVVVETIPPPLQLVVDAILARPLMDSVARTQVTAIVAAVMDVVADAATDVETATVVAVGMEVVMVMDLPAPPLDLIVAQMDPTIAHLPSHLTPLLLGPR